MDLIRKLWINFLNMIFAYWADKNLRHWFQLVMMQLLAKYCCSYDLRNWIYGHFVRLNKHRYAIKTSSMSWIKSNDISSKKHSSPSFYICGGFKFISLLSNKDVINQAHMHAIALSCKTGWYNILYRKNSN